MLLIRNISEYSDLWNHFFKLKLKTFTSGLPRVADVQLADFQHDGDEEHKSRMAFFL